MELLERIIKCENKRMIDEIITEELKRINFNATKKNLSGIDTEANDKCLFRGFIPSSGEVDLSDGFILFDLDIKDIFYEFAYYVNRIELRNNTALVYGLEYFLTEYFKKHDIINYDRVFSNHLAKKMGYKERLKTTVSIKKTVLAEQLLNLFGIDTSLCLGTMENDNIGEMHGFNIVKRQIGYLIVDYDMPIHSYRYNGVLIADYPFVEPLTSIEYKDFVVDGKLEEFNDYNMVDGNKKYLMRKRGYIVQRYKDKNVSKRKI